MNRDIRQLWLDGLRSGEYSQTKGLLIRHEPGQFNAVGDVEEVPAGWCCLGVLADRCVHAWPEHFEWEDNWISYPSVQYDAEGWVSCDPTQRHKQIAQLDGMGFLFGFNELDQDECVHMNDIEASTFAEIADWIEEHIEPDDEPPLFLVPDASGPS